jgi:two-component system, LuxR family, response regulator FixJ
MQKQSEVSVQRSIVIVVDDDPAIRNSLKFSLEIEGFAVRTYACATEPLDSSDFRFGRCFVIDQRTPGMSGLDLIANLRARHISAPAILITSLPTPTLTKRGVQADIPIVEKPLLGNALLEHICAACAQSQPTLR